jgi:hypothetical protein
LPDPFFKGQPQRFALSSMGNFQAADDVTTKGSLGIKQGMFSEDPPALIEQPPAQCGRTEI